MKANPRSAPEVPVVLDGRVSRAQRLREERRAQVLDTARRLFADRGYHQTSINDIIAAAGIARGTFYLYFESKRAVFEELLDGLFVTLASAVQRVDVSASAAPPLEQVHGTVLRILTALADQREIARILFRSAVGIDAEFDQKLADFYGRVSSLIARGLTLGMQMGLVRACDPQLASWCVLGSVKEVVARYFVVGDTMPELESISRELVAFNLRGVFL